MITKPTVFVLGAGASVPYGFPTGAELRLSICKNFHNKLSGIRSSVAYIKNHEPDELETQCNNFTKAFMNSGNSSIDLFLSRRREFYDLGKMAIVMEILEAEKASNFCEDSRIPEQDWYSYLFNRMTEDIRKSEDWTSIINNQVHFITFNYDRSLEYFLFQCIYNSFSLQESDWGKLRNVLRNIHISHVYGQIFKLVWELETDGRVPVEQYLGYGRAYDFETIQESIKNIFTIYEERELIKKTGIREKMFEAERIFFLGFGFAPENMEILGIPASINPNTEVYGTSFGLKGGEINRIMDMFDGGRKEGKRVGPDKERVILKSSSCLDLLREYL
ncbi:MAG: hypothetical protein ACM3Q2_16955 [Syntrophothermus sp.]